MEATKGLIEATVSWISPQLMVCYQMQSLPADVGFSVMAAIKKPMLTE